MRPSHEDSDHGFASGQMCHGPGPAAENWMRLNSGAMDDPFRMLTCLSLQCSENETREKEMLEDAGIWKYIWMYLEDFGRLNAEQHVRSQFRHLVLPTIYKLLAHLQTRISGKGSRFVAII